jgi:replicative DNA helicase
VASQKQVVAIIEKQILHALYEGHSIPSSENYFVSDVGRNSFEVYRYLKDNGLSYIKEHFIKYAPDDSSLNEDTYESIFSTEYQVEKIDTYFQELKTNYHANKISIELFPALAKVTSRNGKKDIEELKRLSRLINDSIKSIYESDESLMTFNQYVEDHELILNKRKEGIERESSGCFWFDELLPGKSLIPGLIIVFGHPASGKSTFADYIDLKRFIKKMPTLKINTELAHSIKIDNYICSLCDLDYYDVLGVNNEEQLLEEHVLEAFHKMQKRFQDNKYFVVERKQSVSLADLPDMIDRARDTMEIPSERLLFVSIDLLTQMTEYSESAGMSRADSIELANNELNAIALAKNCCILGVVQPRRAATKLQITELEDLEKMRPTLEIIKSSGSFEERARLIFGIHSPYLQAKKYLFNNPIVETMDKTIEIQLLKSNFDGQSGMVKKYLHFGSKRALLPFREDEDE